MATTSLPPESAETQQQYATQLLLTATLVQALRQLWGSTLPLNSPAAQVRYRDGVAAIVAGLSGAASSFALDYYQSVRVEAGVTTALPPRVLQPVPPPPRSLTDAGVDWGLSLEDEFRRMEAELADQAAAVEERMQARVEAAMQKALADVSREQVADAVAGDELALGFRRVPRPDACYFCVVMAIRSTTRKGLAADFKRYVPGSLGGVKHYGVYKSRLSAGVAANVLFEGEGTAKFHNNCHCVIEPVFSPVEILPAWLADMERLYDDTEGGLEGFRKALAAHRRGEKPHSPPVPALVAPGPAQQEAIAALLDLFPQVA